MTTKQLKERVLELIKQWAQNPEVQQSELTINVLQALAGDIEVISLD